jgi:hypothetical protein
MDDESTGGIGRGVVIRLRTEYNLAADSKRRPDA